MEIFIKYIFIPFVLTNLIIKILQPYFKKYLMDYPNKKEVLIIIQNLEEEDYHLSWFQQFV